VALGTALGLVSGVLFAQPTENQTGGEFPYAVSFDVGRTQFLPGDNITVESVRGTAGVFKTNETYCIEGTYTLNSRDEAQLALFVTTRQDIRTKTDPRQMLRIRKGRGSFRLVEPMVAEGYPHVSFYPVHSGGDFGGVYFGRGAWLWAEAAPGPRMGQGGDSPSVGLLFEGPNRAIFEYLGNPVEPPAQLDSAYTREGLTKALRLAAKRAGVSLAKIEIEDSEFPFLAGLVGEPDAVANVRSELKKMSAYEDCGGVSGHNCYALNIVPWRTFPPEAAQRIGHRLNVREQMFYDKLAATESK